MTSRTIIESSQKLSALVLDGKVVFFVGSGVSLSYPACLPSVTRILELGLSLYLPKGSSDYKTNILDNIMPEVFYHELMAFIGENALLPFRVLAHPSAKPTLAHYFIVWASIRAQVPIITTNFDCLLEKASRDLLGIEPMVVLPSGPYSDHTHPLPVWKVHGSIDMDILATMPQITQPNPILLKALQSLLADRHICFVGYSGSDIDLFPMIKDLPGIKDPFWVDPFPSETLMHRARSIGATFIESTLDQIFSAGPSDFLGELRKAKLYQFSVHNQAKKKSKIESEIEGELSRIKNSAFAEYPFDPDRQKFFLAICLARIGEPKSALKYLHSHDGLQLGLGQQDKVLLLLTMARLNDCVSDYRNSEDLAQKAFIESRALQSEIFDQKAIALRIQSLHALSMAKKMQLGPHFSYGVSIVDFSPSALASLAVLVRYFSTAHKMKKLLHSLQGDTFTPKDKIWVFSAWHWYLDHMLILLSLFEATAKRIPLISTFTARRIRHKLKHIKEQALQQGDARILAHVQKELQRHGLTSAADLPLAFAAYDLVTDHLNSALIHRNNGDILFKQGKTNKAKHEFKKALDSATQCGSKATVLKALVGLYVCGERISEAEFLSKVKGLSGFGYDRCIAKLRRALQ